MIYKNLLKNHLQREAYLSSITAPRKRELIEVFLKRTPIKRKRKKLNTFSLKKNLKISCI